MTFTHDTVWGLRGTAALVNTLPTPSRRDRLTTRDQLDRFAAAWRWTGSRRHDDDELELVRALRPRLQAIWSMPEPAVVVEVNALLAQAPALPQLVDHDGWGWHLHATPPEAPLATRMAVEAAMALVDVVRAGELDRLRRCADPDCGHVLVDLSKNRSRRYCEAGCGNRANVAAYRQRRRHNEQVARAD